MNPPDELQENLDLFLDGALSEDEMHAFRRAVQDDPALRSRIRDDLVMSAALESAGASAFTPTVVTPPWWRRVGIGIAAAGLVAAAFVAGRSLSGGDDGVASSGAPVARAGDVIEASASVREVRVGAARLRLRPGGQLSVVSDAPATVALRRGSVEVASPDADARVEVPGFGNALVRGQASLLLGPDTSQRGPYLMVTTFAGDVRVVDGEFTDAIGPGEPRLFDGGGPRLAGEVLARMAELEGDEGLMVLTTSQHAELMATVDQDKEQLQVRIADLLAENERLALELEALQRREPSRRVSLREVLQSMALVAEKEGLNHRSQIRWWRRIRAVVRTYGQGADDLVDAIEDTLLAPGASASRQRLGMWFLTRVRGRKSVEALLERTGDQDVEVRLAAVEGLARQRRPRCRAALRSAFRSDRSLLVRISAAGGLVSLGDYGEPLQWLLEQYELRPRHPEYLRRRILGRVVTAPLAQSKAEQYIIELCLSQEASFEWQREVVHLLARLGDETARTTLEFVAEAAPRRKLRELAVRCLARLDSDDR